MSKTNAQEKARFLAEMSESFDDLHALGLIDDAQRKRTLRDISESRTVEIMTPMSGSEIRALREEARVSQAFLAKYLNLSPDHLSKLERGAVKPTGALLAMLNVIRRKGLDVIL